MIVRTAASLLAIAWAGGVAAPALAQTQGAPDQQQSSTLPGNADPRSEATTSDEILVTAQRRSERLVDVPLSVATVSGEEMEQAGGDSIENLTRVVPGVYLQRAQYGLSPTVRGVGSTLAASSGEQNVAMYVDEIYYPTPTGNIFDLASVSGIEVLKGPQGTLFGRNATGGAILLRTLDPSFTPEGRFNVSYERFDQVRTGGYLNVPLSESVAVNASVAYRHSDGYVRDLLTDEITNEGENFTSRIKLLVEPTNDLSIVFTASRAVLDDPTGVSSVNLQPALAVAVLGGPIAGDRFHSSNAARQMIRTEANEYSIRARLELDAGTLSSFTAYLQNELDSVSELTGSYLNVPAFGLPAVVINFNTYTDTFTQEVNFASREDQPFTYVAGVYYFRNQGGLPYFIQQGAPQFFNQYDDWSISAYADGAYAFGDLSLIAGIRYTYEEISADSGFGATEATGTYSRFQRGDDAQWTPRVGLRYALDDQTNIYATYSRGFKSGRSDRSSPTGPGVDAETVDAYEAGYKHASPNFSFNAAAFYYDYQDTQVNTTVVTSGGAIVTALINAPESEIYGAEMDASLRLNDNFDLRTAVAYTHARYTSFPQAVSYINDPSDPTTVGGLVFSQINVDASGNHMVRSPEWTASATLSYHTPVGGNNELELALSSYYSSRVFFTFDNRLSQGSYLTLDGTATLSIGENTRLSVFGRNLTDEEYYTGAGQGRFSLEQVTFGPPKMFGVSLGYSF
ncbi:MAG: TonB-dependent receptor [Hyphomonadaceae bacterium]|nr:TonB-dependent receptor [Hyphomonadaceae bacterium]